MREGQPTRLPYRVARVMVAARHGTSPAAVDGWPVGDFLDARNMLDVSRG